MIPQVVEMNIQLGTEYFPHTRYLHCVSRCRSELAEFTMWDHLPQADSPLPCFTNRVFSMNSLAGNLHSLRNQVLWVHFWRHCGIYQNEDLITRCSNNAFYFYQDVCSDCFSFVIMRCTRLEGRCILQDRTWHQKLILNFLFKEHIYCRRQSLLGAVF